MFEALKKWLFDQPNNEGFKNDEARLAELLQQQAELEKIEQNQLAQMYRLGIVEQQQADKMVQLDQSYQQLKQKAPTRHVDHLFLEKQQHSSSAKPAFSSYRATNGDRPIVASDSSIFMESDAFTTNQEKSGNETKTLDHNIRQSQEEIERLKLKSSETDQLIANILKIG